MTPITTLFHIVVDPPAAVGDRCDGCDHHDWMIRPRSEKYKRCFFTASVEILLPDQQLSVGWRPVAFRRTTSRSKICGSQTSSSSSSSAAVFFVWSQFKCIQHQKIKTINSNSIGRRRLSYGVATESGRPSPRVKRSTVIERLSSKDAGLKASFIMEHSPRRRSLLYYDLPFSV